MRRPARLKGGALAPGTRKPHQSAGHSGRGYCPVCGARLDWIATAHLWPTRRSAQAILPSSSGACSRCHRLLVFTVLEDATEDPDDTSE